MTRSTLALFVALPLGAAAADLPDNAFGVRAEGTKEGLKLILVHSDTLADQMGLREGGLISKVNNTRIRNPDELKKALGDMRGRITIEYVPRGEAKALVLSGTIKQSPVDLGKFIFERDKNSPDPRERKP